MGFLLIILLIGLVVVLMDQLLKVEEREVKISVYPGFCVNRQRLAPYQKHQVFSTHYGHMIDYPSEQFEPEKFITTFQFNGVLAPESVSLAGEVYFNDHLIGDAVIVTKKTTIVKVVGLIPRFSQKSVEYEVKKPTV